MEVTVHGIREYIREQEIKTMYVLNDCLSKNKLGNVSMYHGYKIALEYIRDYIDNNGVEKDET